MVKKRIYFSPLDDLMSSFKDEFFFGRGEKERRESVWYPAVDIYEIGTGIIVVAELSGVKKDNLEIFLEGENLVIKGKRYEPVYNFIKCHHREVLYGDFTRSVRVPSKVDGETIKAELVEGLLLVFLPIKDEGATRIRID